MKGSGLTENRKKAGGARGRKRGEQSRGVHDLEWGSQSQPFSLTGAQLENSVPYLCLGTRTYSNPMTNAGDNSITEDLNRGYLGDS